MKLTPWFPATVKPVRAGVYRTRPESSTSQIICYSYWSGRKWGFYKYTKRHAISAMGESPVQNKEWRGVLK